MVTSTHSDDMSSAGKVYLEMIYHKATHMGCGIIGYTEYAYHDNNADVIYNVSTLRKLIRNNDIGV